MQIFLLLIYAWCHCILAYFSAASNFKKCQVCLGNSRRVEWSRVDINHYPLILNRKEVGVGAPGKNEKWDLAQFFIARKYAVFLHGLVHIATERLILLKWWPAVDAQSNALSIAKGMRSVLRRAKHRAHSGRETIREKIRWLLTCILYIFHQTTTCSRALAIKCEWCFETLLSPLLS